MNECMHRIQCPILGDIGWYSHGGGKSKIKVSAGLVPSEGSEENLSLFLVVAGSVGVPRLSEASLLSLRSSSDGVLPICVCVLISPFYKDTSHIRLGPNHSLIFPGEGSDNRLQYPCLGNLWTERPGGLQSAGSLRVRYD